MRHQSRKRTTRAVGSAIGFAIALAIAGPVPAQAAPGQQLWVARHDGRGGGEGVALAVAPDGSRAYVVGRGLSAGSSDYLTIAYDASTGAVVWSSRYDGPAGGQEQPAAIAVSPDGSRVYVTGWSMGVGTDEDYATVAYDAATGRHVWVKRYDGRGSGPDDASDIGTSSDGKIVFVTGASWDRGKQWVSATIAYDAATGAELWVRRYVGTASGYGGVALAVSPDGAGLYVTGAADFSGNADIVTVAYAEATGARLWVRRYRHPVASQDRPDAIAVSPDGTRVFVTGESSGRGGPLGYVTIGYDAATGARDWIAYYVGEGTAESIPTDIVVAPDSAAVYVTGASPGPTNVDDYLTIAYDAASGRAIWKRRYNGTANDYDSAIAIAVAPDGGIVYVTGLSTQPETGWDYATIAYAAQSGSQIWLQTYDGPGHFSDAAKDVAVTPDGSRVFVTGWSWISAKKTGFATVAYSTS